MEKDEVIGFKSHENYKHHLDIWRRTYNISREKLELFHDFLISLYELVDTTYLGDDELVYTDQDFINHFNWCWDRVIDNFTKEKIYFKSRGNYHEYFWNFFMDAYYFSKLDTNSEKINEYFDKVFNFNLIKTRAELDLVTEIYKLFDQNLKK